MTTAPALDAIAPADIQSGDTIAHPDWIDVNYANSPDHAECPNCNHWWPLDDMNRTRSYDLICPDCINAGSDHPDRRP